MRFLVAAILFALAMPGHAGTTDPRSFHEQVDALYSFSPRTLKDANLKTKSKELDAFWSSVKDNGQTGLEELRKELARSDSSPFFSYDGAKLLLSLSKTKEDRALALTSMNRTDIRDLQRTDYFLTIHSFAVEEFDTSVAAFKILEDEQFKVFIPQHSLTLEQEMCLLFLLLPTKESFYLEKAERRLFAEKSVTAQKSLLTLLGYTVTKKGDDAIARFAAATDKPTESRDYATVILKATKEMQSAAVLGLSTSTYSSLKDQQRKLFGRVSDEALYESERSRIKIRRKGPE